MDNSLEYYKQKYEPVFGEWKIVKILGEGGFGKVFEIRREEFGMTYAAALKLITIPKSDNEFQGLLDNGFTEETAKTYYQGIVNDVAREFILMSGLKGHSNIVSFENHKVYEHENGFGWDILIQMELLLPLNTYLKTSGLTEETVIKLGIDMCRALELCGKRNIIHRDIKPENVFVNADGDFKLGDFGIARQIEKTQSGLTKIGTPTYMAPEVYKGKEYGFTVDIYSVGVMMYKLLNHNRVPFLPPFPAQISYTDIEAAQKRRLDGEVIPPPDGTANKALCDIVLKACSFNSKDRFQSASEMKEALKKLAFDSKTESTTVAATINLKSVHAPEAADYSANNIDKKRVETYENDTVSKKRALKVPLILAAVLSVVVICGIVAWFSKKNNTESFGGSSKQDTDVVENKSVLIEQGNLTDTIFYKIYSDGKLVIDGAGNMPDWNSETYKRNSYESTPWYKHNITELIIGQNISSIGAYSFMDSNITSVDLGNISSIGNGAFYNCSKLLNVTIPKSVETIGSVAFGNCTSLSSINVDKANENYSSDSEGVLFDKDKITLLQYPIGKIAYEYNIPQSVSTISDAAFFSSYMLDSVDLANASYIGINAFAMCGLDYLNLSNVKEISDTAFQFCLDLKSVTISDKLEYIGESVFNSCSSLSQFVVNENNPTFSSDEHGVLFNKDKTILIQYPIGNKLSVYRVPETTLMIQSYAFSWCSNLTLVNLGNVMYIGESAFHYCDSLTSVIIPESVLYLGYNTFDNCNKLKRVSIYNDSMSFEAETIFRNCDEKLILYCNKNSTTETFARENGIKFSYLEE